jgi:hypothetical protein
MAELVFVQQLYVDHGGTPLQEKVKNVPPHNQVLATMAIWNNLAP